MSQNFKLAVIGNKSTVLIFKALGTEVHSVSNTEEARDTLDSLVSEHHDDEKKTPKYAVIFVEEIFYKTLPEDVLVRLSKRPLPAVVPIPSPGSDDKNFGVKRLSKIVERAVGSDIAS